MVSIQNTKVHRQGLNKAEGATATFGVGGTKHCIENKNNTPPSKLHRKQKQYSTVEPPVVSREMSEAGGQLKPASWPAGTAPGGSVDQIGKECIVFQRHWVVGSVLLRQCTRKLVPECIKCGVIPFFFV
jgi:hypothetical protein